MLTEFFSYPDDGYEFNYFSFDHLTPLFIMFISIYLLYKYRQPIRHFKYEQILRYFFATLIILTQLSYGLNNAYIGYKMTESLQLVNPPIQATVQKDLPLSLCGISMLLTGIMLILKSQKLFNILYFWVFCGSSLALLLPSALKVYNYPYDFGPTRYRYYQFFIGHIGIVLLIVYMLVVHSYKINKNSFVFSYIWLNVFALTTLLINYLIGSNYLFLVNPNDTGLSFFPQNDVLTLITFGVGAFLLFVVAYLPWHFSQIKKVKSVSSNLTIKSEKIA